MTTEKLDISKALNPHEAISAARQYRLDNEDALIPLTPLRGLTALFEVYQAIDATRHIIAPGTMEFLATLGAGLADAAKEQHDDIEDILYRASDQYREQCLRSLERAEMKRQSQAEGEA